MMTPERKQPRADSESDAIKVFVRVRPFIFRETEKCSRPCVEIEANSIRLTDARKCKDKFVFNKCFWSADPTSRDYANQTHVHEHCGKPAVAAVMGGYNACVFAYGQTASGKTYTMYGDKGSPGIMPRVVTDLFATINARKNECQTSIRVVCSYFEIYNERVQDLLQHSEAAKGGEIYKGLRIRRHPISGPYVEGLRQVHVDTEEQCMRLLNEGAGCRQTACTKVNDTSSRSHAIFQLVVHRMEINESSNLRSTCTLNLVDLAGSERVSATEATGLRLQEAAHVNLSLHTLRKVIDALCERQVAAFRTPRVLPYRDSILTWLLSESLGGNSKTILISTVSPSAGCINETLSTLRFSNRAKMVVNKVRINESSNDSVVEDLRREIVVLQRMIQESSKGPLSNRRIKDLEDEIALHKQAIDQAEEQKRRAEAEIEERQQREQHLENKLVQATAELGMMQTEGYMWRSSVAHLEEAIQTLEKKFVDHRRESIAVQTKMQKEIDLREQELRRLRSDPMTQSEIDEAHELDKLRSMMNKVCGTNIRLAKELSDKDDEIMKLKDFLNSKSSECEDVTTQGISSDGSRETSSRDAGECDSRKNARRVTMPASASHVHTPEESPAPHTAREDVLQWTGGVEAAEPPSRLFRSASVPKYLFHSPKTMEMPSWLTEAFDDAPGSQKSSDFPEAIPHDAMGSPEISQGWNHDSASRSGRPPTYRSTAPSHVSTEDHPEYSVIDGSDNVLNEILATRHEVREMLNEFKKTQTRIYALESTMKKSKQDKTPSRSRRSYSQTIQRAGLTSPRLQRIARSASQSLLSVKTMRAPPASPMTASYMASASLPRSTSYQPIITLPPPLIYEPFTYRVAAPSYISSLW